MRYIFTRQLQTLMTSYRFQALFLKFNRADKLLRKPFRPKKAKAIQYRQQMIIDA
jgi:hypothetical protein